MTSARPRKENENLRARFASFVLVLFHAVVLLAFVLLERMKAIVVYDHSGVRGA